MPNRPMGLFTDHPASVGESYLQHMGHALFFSGQFALCTVACLLHALVPCLFTTSASQRTQRLIQHMQNRGTHNGATNPSAQPGAGAEARWPLEATMCTERP